MIDISHSYYDEEEEESIIFFKKKTLFCNFFKENISNN